MTNRRTPSALQRPPIPQADDDDDEPQSTERPTLNPPYDVETFARDSDSKLRAVAPVSGSRTTVDEVRRWMAEGEHEEALRLATATLAVVPLHAELHDLAEQCAAEMEWECLSEVGGLRAIPRIAIPPSELLRFTFDGPTGFLLSQLDGRSSVEDLLDLVALPRHRVLGMLAGLVKRGIVRV